MRQAYYTDSRIAGYMHETFGMHFVENFEIIEMYLEGRLTKETHDGKIHIDPNSIVLLQPQSGDLVTCKLGIVGCVSKPHDDGPVGVWWAGSQREGSLNGKERIIERDGKLFHWPQQDS